MSFSNLRIRRASRVSWEDGSPHSGLPQRTPHPKALDGQMSSNVLNCRVRFTASKVKSDANEFLESHSTTKMHSPP